MGNRPPKFAWVRLCSPDAREMPPQLPSADADLLRQGAGVVSDHSRAVFPVRYGVKATHSFERLKIRIGSYWLIREKKRDLSRMFPQST